jgi:glycylpeptide N-tetradecanoyltransferase
VIDHPKHSHVNAAYLYYYVPLSVEGVSVQEGSKRVVKDAMIMAHRLGFDVFNCLDLMDNAGFLEDLRFGRGDGVLKYYLFNYRLNPIAPDALGLVLH